MLPLDSECGIIGLGDGVVGRLLERVLQDRLFACDSELERNLRRELLAFQYVGAHEGRPDAEDHESKDQTGRRRGWFLSGSRRCLGCAPSRQASCEGLFETSDDGGDPSVEIVGAEEASTETGDEVEL